MYKRQVHSLVCSLSFGQTDTLTAQTVTMDSQTADRQTSDRRTNIDTDSQPARQTERQRETDKQTDRETDKQTERQGDTNRSIQGTSYSRDTRDEPSRGASE